MGLADLPPQSTLPYWKVMEETVGRCPQKKKKDAKEKKKRPIKNFRASSWNAESPPGLLPLNKLKEPTNKQMEPGASFLLA